MNTFLEFLDRKQRQGKHHLELIGKLLEQNGLQVSPHLDDSDPYVFVKSPQTKLSFEGVRVYHIGNIIAYRVQKEENTHPFGSGRNLNLEQMFNDFMSDKMKPDEAGKKVIESVVEEIKKFFKDSAVAEDELRKNDPDGAGTLMIKSGGTDYSSQVASRS